MTWTNEDGTHEGWAGTLFADGWIGSGWESGESGQPSGVSVATGPDGSFRWAERTVRPDAEVIGWVPACECGWRGQVITRVEDPASADLGARRAYSVDAFAPDGIEDGLAHPEWAAHVEPLDLVAVVAAAHREHVRAGAALDAAVAAARVAGASWGDVGRATGMARQSANERWSRRLPL